MIKYKALYLIGSSHIAIESVNLVESSFSKINPSIVALELDSQRAASLMSSVKKPKIRLSDIKRLGFKGFLFNLIGAWLEKKLAKSVNIEPGAEMKKAIELARLKRKKIALIDQPIEITLKKLSSRMTLKEKLRFIKEAFVASIFRNKKYQFDLRKVPEEKVIAKLTAELKAKFPSVYLTLIEERNIYMAKNLYKLMISNKRRKILAVVGAGHASEICKLVKNEFKQA